MNKIIFKKTYNWESSYDIERDVLEAIEETEQVKGDEWPGTIKIIIEYDPKGEE